MPLNIKDADTHALAKRLASLTGESLTKAVKRAIQDRLAQVEKPQGQAAWPTNWTTSPCTAPISRATIGRVPIRSSATTCVVSRRDGRRHVGARSDHGR